MRHRLRKFTELAIVHRLGRAGKASSLNIVFACLPFEKDRGTEMKYRIYDLETDREWFSNDDAEAHRLSYEHDRYDITILENEA